jgi:hypothetical protein
LLLGAIFYFLLPKTPKPISIAPAASQPVPAPPPRPSASRPAPVTPAPEVKANTAPKTHAKKHEEIEVKPAEPKIIR